MHIAGDPNNTKILIFLKENEIEQSLIKNIMFKEFAGLQYTFKTPIR